MSAPGSLPVLARLAPRVYYGWFIAVGCGLLSFAVVGVGFYGVVVFLDALVAVRGWDPIEVSAATSLYWIVTAVAGMALGRSVDRFGARGFLAAGIVVMAAALVWIGRLEDPDHVFPAYVLLGIGFSLAGNIPNSAIITRWFVQRRSTAMMISHTGVSIGGMLLVPVSTGWIEADGLTVTTDRLAILLLVVGLPVILWVLRFDPRAFDLEPDGGGLPESDRPELSPAHQQRAWRRRDVLRSRAFQRLAAAFGLMLFCQVAFAMHELAFLRGRIGAELAALAVSTTAASSFAARFVIGYFADRVAKRKLAAGLFGMQAAMIALAAVAEGAPALLLAAAGFGATVGSIFLLQALLVGELFGMESFGAALGLQQLVSQATSGLGPLALGALYGYYGAYEPALAWLVGGAAVATVLVWRVRPAVAPA